MTLLQEIFPDVVLRQLATEIASQLPFDMPFSPQDLSTLPTTHNNRDCTNCNADLDIPTPAGYFYETPLNSEITFEPSTTADVSYVEGSGLFVHVPNNPNTNYHTQVIDIDEVAFKARVGADSVHGVVVKFKEASGFLGNGAGVTSFPTTNGEDVAWVQDRVFLAFDGSEYANVSEFNAFCEQYADRGNYGNGEPTLRWSSDTYGQSDPGYINYEILIVCKGNG